MYNLNAKDRLTDRLKEERKDRQMKINIIIRRYK